MNRKGRIALVGVGVMILFGVFIGLEKRITESGESDIKPMGLFGKPLDYNVLDISLDSDLSLNTRTLYYVRILPTIHNKSVLTDIVKGELDAQLKRIALSLSALDQPLLISFAPIANTDVPWSLMTLKDPVTQYQDAFNYVMTFMSEYGLDQRVWIYETSLEQSHYRYWMDPSAGFVDGVDGVALSYSDPDQLEKKVLYHINQLWIGSNSLSEYVLIKMPNTMNEDVRLYDIKEMIPRKDPVEATDWVVSFFKKDQQSITMKSQQSVYQGRLCWDNAADASVKLSYELNQDTFQSQWMVTDDSMIGNDTLGIYASDSDAFEMTFTAFQNETQSSVVYRATLLGTDTLGLVNMNSFTILKEIELELDQGVYYFNWDCSLNDLSIDFSLPYELRLEISFYDIDENHPKKHAVMMASKTILNGDEG